MSLGDTICDTLEIRLLKSTMAEVREIDTSAHGQVFQKKSTSPVCPSQWIARL